MDPFDLIIIGGGINGAGIARDVAMRGLRVLLLEKGDLCSGTSAWSTRLIHGGLRYLEHGEIGLVRESLREREVLLRTASHLVKPLPLLIPIYAGARRGPAAIRLGMMAYDLLSFDKSLEHHRMLSPAEVRQRAGGLLAEGLRGAALYYDAQVQYAERLVVENALSAVEHGAAVRTYCRVDGFLWHGRPARGSAGAGPQQDSRAGRPCHAVSGVRYTDLATGQAHEAEAPITLNVAGPWVDRLLASLDPRPRRLLGTTKGSHIIVALFPGAPADAVYVEARADARPFFTIPWNGLYLIGTTDIRTDVDPDEVTASDAEIDYLLRETNRIFPSAGLTRASVLYTYSGLRPLPYAGTGPEAAITRRHIVHDHAPAVAGLISIVGGKLTTYRSLAQQAVDLVCEKLGRRSRCATAHTPLPGSPSDDAASFEADFMQTCGLPARSAQHLLRTYGRRAARVMEIASEAPELRQPFDDYSGAIGAEVVMALRHELAQTLTDIMLRRTMAGWGPGLGMGADERAARIAQRHGGWDEARVGREVSEYRAYLRRLGGMAHW